MMVLGVDAGGTRTTAAVADRSGAILARAESGPGAIRPDRVPMAAAAVYGAARDALQRARIAAPVSSMVIGASGAGNLEQRAALAAALEGCGLAARMTVTTDAEIALSAGFDQAPGVVVIAGTGSVAWAQLEGGERARAGGLGPVMGDRGSGHDIGREALRAVGAGLELGLKLELTNRVLAHLGIEEKDLPAWSLSANVAKIAALAPLVLDAAAAGDSIAKTIAHHGAAHLAGLVAVLTPKFASPPAVAFGGGLLTRRGYYRDIVARHIREAAPGARVADEGIDAVLGAIRIARQQQTTTD